MEKDYTFAWILLFVVIGIFSTVTAFLARESMTAALTLIWAPIAVEGTYLLGKRAGRGE